MSRLDHVITPAFTVAVARQVLDHHAAGGTCQSCRPDDCPETVWALAEVAAHHARRQTCPR